MCDDEDALRKLNIAIGDAENRGDAEWLAQVLAPRLAFQRADARHTVDDQVAFLQKVTPNGNRVTRIIEPVQVYGDRAIVQCTVAVGTEEYHNLRLFVRHGTGWKLLGWANERT